MVTNSGFKEAPPTKNPSISGCPASSLQLAPVTEPPYWIRIFSATCGLTFLSNQPRRALCTSCACSGVAVFPVPMAQTGSYATTTLDLNSPIIH